MHHALLKVSELLAERSKGRIRLEVQPSVSVPDQIEMLINGSDEIAMVSMSGLSDYYRPLGALEAPYVFRDLDHFYHTIESPFWRTLTEEVQARAHLRVIDVWHQGIRQVTLKDRPATTPQEFGQIRLRVPAGAMFVEAARVLGALPTTMPLDDVYNALRSGTVDGQENPLPTIKAMRFQEVCKYLIMTNHVITPMAPIVGEHFWKRLTPEEQSLITDAFHDGGAYNRRIVEEQERQLMEEFAREGMTVLHPGLTVFRERAEQSWRRFRDVWGDSLVAEIQAVN